MSEVYYFGCIQTAGHFLFDRHQQHVDKRNTGIPWRWLDGSLAPHYKDCGFNDVIDDVGHIKAYCVNRSGQPRPMCSGIDGIAKLHHKDGWTAVAFWDRSVDHRPGSNSAFIFHEDLTFTEALAIAKAQFSSIFARFTFEISEAPLK